MSTLKKVCTLAELKTKVRVLFREDNAQIVVFMSNDKAYALDNRCPHQGYPLMEGELNDKNCTLTCHWHNWKFDINSGEAKVGQDAVRTYPVVLKRNAQNEEEVWLDVRPQDPGIVYKKRLKSIQQAFDKRQYGRIARDLSRMHFEGFDLLDVAAAAIDWSYKKLEFGTRHGYAALADWIQIYYRESTPLNKITVINEALDALALESLRHPDYPYHTNDSALALEKAKTLSLEQQLTLLQNALLAQQEAESVGYFEALLTDASTPLTSQLENIKPVFIHAALGHYNDFGHSLIYVMKMFTLIDQLGTRVARPLGLALIRSLCYATREDMIPEFKNYGPSFKKLVTVDQNKEPAAPRDSHLPEFKNLQGASVNKAFEWLALHWQSHTPKALYTTLLKANAHNLLYFDTSYLWNTKSTLKQDVGWLDLTHGLTFANAVRWACEQYPEYWNHGLLQMAAFYGRNVHATDLVQDVQAHYTATKQSETFLKKSLANAIDHGMTDSVQIMHIIKTLCAVEEEACELNSPEILLAALHKYLTGPQKLRHTQRVTHQSLQLVSKDYA